MYVYFLNHTGRLIILYMLCTNVGTFINAYMSFCNILQSFGDLF